MLEYIGNVSSSSTISTTGRLRKLFAYEFENETATRELEMVIDEVLKNEWWIVKVNKKINSIAYDTFCQKGLTW